MRISELGEINTRLEIRRTVILRFIDWSITFENNNIRNGLCGTFVSSPVIAAQ